MKKHVLTFVVEKTTKNAVRYQEEVQEGQPAVIGTLYAQKWAVGETGKLKVTVEEGK